MITKALIDRFLKNECNEEERQLVLNYLDNHPEEWEQLMPEDEFHEPIQQAQTTSKGELIYLSISGKLFRRKAIVRKLKWGLTAAACVALIGMLTWLFLPAKQTGNNTTVVSSTVAPAKWFTRANTTAQPLAILLPDSSQVTLQPGAILQFRERFNDYAERTIKLAGEGLFKVRKNPNRPFTVVSDDLQTTALGTSFTVHVNTRQITVHLHTGKVVVKSSEAAATKMTKDYYLLPGDELTYQKGATLAAVTKATNDHLAEVTTSGAKNKVALTPNWYKFGGQPLSQVFEQLSSYYGVAINYRKADVANRYFTGKFAVTDSVEVILKDIAVLHNLVLKRSNGVYVLRKSQ